MFIPGQNFVCNFKRVVSEGVFATRCRRLCSLPDKQRLSHRPRTQRSSCHVQAPGSPQPLQLGPATRLSATRGDALLPDVCLRFSLLDVCHGLLALMRLFTCISFFFSLSHPHPNFPILKVPILRWKEAESPFM